MKRKIWSWKKQPENFLTHSMINSLDFNLALMCLYRSRFNWRNRGRYFIRKECTFVLAPTWTTAEQWVCRHRAPSIRISRRSNSTMRPPSGITPGPRRLRAPWATGRKKRSCAIDVIRDFILTASGNKTRWEARTASWCRASIWARVRRLGGL